MKKKSRGQVTIFIIIAIVIVVAGVLFFIFKNSFISKNSTDPEISQIKNFVIDCIKKSGESAIYTIGQNGGYYFPKENSNSFGVPYYFKNQNETMPTLEEIEKEVSYYVHDSLPLCTEDFKEFANYNITIRETVPEVSIFQNKVVLSGKYPLVIRKGDSTVLIEDFGDVEIPVRLGKIYSIAKDVVENQIETSGEICISCALELNEEGISTSIKTNDNAIMYNIYDSKSKLNSQNELLEPEPYQFRFLIEV